MEGYIQVPQNYFTILSNSDIVSYDANKMPVTDLNQHKDKYERDGQYSYNLISGKPLYVTTDDYNKKLQTLVNKQYEKEKIAEDKTKSEHVKIIADNVKIIESVKNDITRIITESDILSQNNIDTFLEKINKSVTKLDNIHTRSDKKNVFQAICQILNDEMDTSLLFSSDSLINITVNNTDININFTREPPYNTYSLKINVPHIIFFYDFNKENPTLSLSKIETEKDYIITLAGTNLTINTSPPLTAINQDGPFSSRKNALYIYKLSEPIETDKNPFKLMNDADESERAERGGKKKTRKHKKRTKSRKGRRKIERSRSFRNKR
jgi:hypothetical protein